MPKRTGLTERSIAEQALALIDAEGLDALSMRRLAGDLDVSPMTLYSYFADRDALLDEVAQLVYAEIVAPDGSAGPRETLRALMHAARDVLLAHPHALPLVSVYPPHTLDALAFVNAGYRALRQEGIAPIDVVRAYRALAAYSLGTATVEINRYFGRQPPPTAAQPDEETLRRHLPYVAEVAPLLAGLDDAAEFDFGLDLTLDGFLTRHGGH
ncbi:MAG: TetR/AcrR family transcriptional regulator [Nocardioidaceae bacterium]